MSLKDAAFGELEALVHVATNIGKNYVYEILNGADYSTKIPANSSPILLYHGYFVTHRCMAGLANSLKKDGFTPFVRVYAYWDDLEKVVQLRSQKLNEFCQRTGRKVDLVGYSLGGLIALRKAQENPHLVDKVIMLGSPLGGTIAAYAPYLIHKSCRQMVPGNDFLKLIE